MNGRTSAKMFIDGLPKSGPIKSGDKTESQPLNQAAWWTTVR